MNKYSNRGKSKHGHASYRHNGTYGKAVDRSTHDQRQVDSMDEQEMESEE